MFEKRRMLSTAIIGFFITLQNVDAYETSLIDSEYCDFRESGQNYSPNDLLRCMFELSSNVVDKENSGSDNGNVHEHSVDQGKKYQQLTNSVSTSRGMTDFLASLINGINAPHASSLITDAIAGYYQTNYPAPANLNGPSGPLSALNLYEALHSISTHDDLKCVPRILCEVASGSPPTDSLYRQSQNSLQDFGKNALFGLLSVFDATGSSPLLTFGKAALLGYTNRKNPGTCYREYPKCPRSPDQLIHYLNNHNGGFFRFFNKYRDRFPLSQQYQRPYPQIPGSYYGRSDDYPPFDPSVPESIRTGTGEIKFDLPVVSARIVQAGFFPRERQESAGRNFVFPPSAKTKYNEEYETIHLLNRDPDFRKPQDIPFFPKAR